MIRNEMTQEEEELVDNFFENSELIPKPTGHLEDGYYKYLWDDYTALQEFSIQNPDLRYYTLVHAEDNEEYIYSGIRKVNRLGYFISRISADLPDGCIRYI